MNANTKQSGKKIRNRIIWMKPYEVYDLFDKQVVFMKPEIGMKKPYPESAFGMENPLKYKITITPLPRPVKKI